MQLRSAGFNRMEFGDNTSRGSYKDISGFGFCDQEIRDISDHLHLFYTGVTRESKRYFSYSNSKSYK